MATFVAAVNQPSKFLAAGRQHLEGCRFRQAWLYHNGREAYVSLVELFSNRVNERSIPIHPIGPSEPNALASDVGVRPGVTLSLIHI